MLLLLRNMGYKEKFSYNENALIHLCQTRFIQAAILSSIWEKILVFCGFRDLSVVVE